MIVRLLLVLTLGVASGVPAQTWEPQSPDGGTVYTVVGTPGGDRRAFALASNALFVSADAGRTWRLPAQRIGGTPGAFAISPLSPARVFLFDSAKRLVRSDDHGDTWIATGHVAPSPPGVLALPVGAVLYAADASVLRSTDDGTTFAATQGLPAGLWTGLLAVNPFVAGQVIAGTRYGQGGPTLYRSVDSGATWSPLFTPALGGEALDVVFVNASTYAVSVSGRIYYTSDDGANWTQIHDLTGARLVRLPQSNELLATNGVSCVRTSTLFATTQDCSAGLPAPIDGEYPTTSLSVVDDGNGADRVLATVRGSGVVALDPGASAWVANNRQLHAHAIRGLALSPRDPAWIVAGRFLPDRVEGPLLATRDAGATWQRSLGGVANYIDTIEFDPTTGPDALATRLYAAGTTVRRAGIPMTSGIYRSDDGGANWTALDDGLPTTSGGSLSGVRLSSVRKVALDPRSCASAPATGPCATGPLNTVFALTQGSGSDASYRLIRSTQGGANWSAVGGDLPAPVIVDDWYEAVFPSDLAFDAGGNAIYVATYGNYYYLDDTPRVPAAIASGVFRSTDGGAHWTQASTGLPLFDGSTTTARDVFALAAHPRRAGLAYASTVESGQSSRIYRTLDGGATWVATSAALSNCDVRDLEIDTAAPDVVVAAGVSVSGGPGCIWRSEDEGATWTPLTANLPATRVMTLRQSSHDRRRLVVATDVGVWSVLAPSDRIFNDGLDNE